MNWNPFQGLFFPKKFLGIDIGTSCIKIVELSQSVNRRKLENYGAISADISLEEPFRTFEKDSILFSTQDVVKAIKTIMEEAKIKTRQAIFSIPDFSTFFTNFELPLMKEEELEQAIQYGARQHIPIPLKEVTLGWQKQVIKGQDSTQKQKLKILLVAVPNKIINQYKEIAEPSQLKIVSLEAEIFSLMRALIKKDEKEPIALVDISVNSTTCSIINGTRLENSYSFDISSNRLDKIIAERYNINYSEAEKLKKRYGLLGGEKDIRQILVPMIDLILMEIQKIFDTFYQKNRQEIQKIILNGGTALLPGLKEYFQIKLKKEVIISQPFTTLDYPPTLEETLKEMGPSYAIAVGAALRGWER